MVATSSNHYVIIEIHEVSYECICLRLTIQHIQESCELPSIKDNRQHYLKIIPHALHISKDVISKEI